MPNFIAIVPTFIDIVPFLINFVPTNNLFLINIAYKSTHTPYRFNSLQLPKFANQRVQILLVYLHLLLFRRSTRPPQGQMYKGVADKFAKRARAQSGGHLQAPVGLGDNFKMFCWISLQNATAAFDLQV